ncbi:hypothetical protein BTH42_29685 [Burkholderia sp. SRS-W-2-2016]|uniref:hypothetical protein n=1 Tax=Burkholderia sp. SRS-W-2-2016 TaxID=1926878 RepID=UPI00094B2721|nr:hypothetical protein [Burkholderia sp. SRS-W-2-2016]OLL28142.1 hypothetical protein BTH42_29685 [Burkholderia sp. SRS-W-2-2016]
MKGFFAFDCVLPETGPVRNFHFLFKPPGKLHATYLADAIEHGLQTVNAPDVVAVVCSSSEEAEIKERFQEPVLVQAADRTSTKVCLCICAFDRDGTLQLRDQLRNPVAGLDSMLRNRTEAIRTAGLDELFSAHHVLVMAPPGFTFVKPSEKRSTLFLRTEEALTEVEGVQFLAFALLHKLKQRADMCKGDLDVIFIDSMGIASVAYALREMYCTLFNAPQPRVVSFHSHDGIEHIDAPLSGTSFCIISASSSLNLEREWRQRTRCHQEEVVTLLTLEDAKGRENALFALPRPNDSNVEQATRHLRDLPIVGEHFAPADLLPKSVLLRWNHMERNAEEFCCKFVRTNGLGVLGRGTAHAKVRPIYLDGTKVALSPGFDAWLYRSLRQRTPASVHAIIHQNDDASLGLAQECARRLTEIMVRYESVLVINETEIAARAVEISKESGLLIVAAVAGRGTRMLSISRDLRDLHEGARTYLIGAQIAETANQIKVLTDNLKYSATKANIEVVRFSQIAIGAGLGESFMDEARLLKNSGTAFGDEYNARIAAIAGTPAGQNARTFIGLNSDLTEPMKLRRDFAFWNFDYDADTAGTTSAVVAMAGAILQNARETKFEDQILRLSTDAFQQVILDPENFARYNDGVIQAALLRCARVGELDYSKEQNASQFMLDLLKRIFEQHDRRQGEAAAEFALALFTQRLRLYLVHRRELDAHLRDSLPADTPRLRLIRAFLELEPLPDNGDLPPEF